MKWSWRRKADGLTMEDIDEKIDEHQQRAEELIHELSVTVEEQGRLWHQIQEKRRGDAGTATC